MTELTRDAVEGAGSAARWVTSRCRRRPSASARAGTARWCTATGRSGDRAAGTSPPSPCAPPGAESPLVRPASFYCHYLSVAEFAPVDLVVTPLRSGRTVLAQRVEMTQGGRPVLDAMVWSVGDVAGLEHEDTAAPDVPGPDELPTRADLWPEDRAGATRSGTTSTRR